MRRIVDFLGGGGKTSCPLSYGLGGAYGSKDI